MIISTIICFCILDGLRTDKLVWSNGVMHNLTQKKNAV